MKIKNNTILIFRSNPYEGTIYDLNCVLKDRHGHLVGIYITGQPKILTITDMEAEAGEGEHPFFSNALYELSPDGYTDMDLFVERVGLVYGLDMMIAVEKHGYMLQMSCPKCKKLAAPTAMQVVGKEYGRSNNVSALHVACPSCFDLETDEVLGAFHDLIKGEEG
jgi:hypothetical protein